MLRQLKVKTKEQKEKIWFSDSRHDLFVWLGPDREPVSFQFSYDKHRGEHCLSWSAAHGYSHSRIDDGEITPAKYKMTPVMVADGDFDARAIADRFERISRDMDVALRQFISDRIRAAASSPGTTD